MIRTATPEEVVKELQRRLGRSRLRANGELPFRCPFHDDRSPSFSVNVSKGVYNCQSEHCGASGTLNKLLKLLDLDLTLPPGGHQKVDAKSIVGSLPPELLYLFDPVEEYRGMTKGVCKHFGVRLDPRLDRTVFPVFDGGDLIGLMGRLNDPDHWLRYKAYTDELLSLVAVDPESLPSIRSVPWGLNLIPDEAEQCVIVEGFMQAMALYSAGIENVVATMGAKVTKAQAESLYQRFEDLIIMFDNDDGGKAGADRLSWLLDGHADVSVIHLPASVRQPDELGHKEILEAFSKREKTMPFGSIRKKMQRLRKEMPKYRSNRFNPGISKIPVTFGKVRFEDDVTEIFKISQAWVESKKSYVRCFCNDPDLPCPLHAKFPDAQARPRYYLGVKVTAPVHKAKMTMPSNGREVDVFERCTRPRCRFCSRGQEVIEDFSGVWQLGQGHYRTLEETDLKEAASVCRSCGEQIELEKASCPDCGEVLYEYSEGASEVIGPDRAIEAVYIEGMHCSSCGTEVMPDEEIQCYLDETRGKEIVKKPSCKDPERDSVFGHEILVSQSTKSGNKWTEIHVDMGDKIEEADLDDFDPIDVKPMVQSWTQACEKAGVNPDDLMRASGQKLGEEERPY